MLKRLVIFSGVALFIIGAIALARTGHYDVLSTHGIIAEKQRSLLIFTLLLSAIVVIPVFTMLALFAWKYRDRTRDSQAHTARYTPNWASNNTLEIIWWAIPIAIIGVLAVIAWTTSHSLDPYRRIESNNKPIEVQVVALQWKWLFIYPELGVAAVNQLPVPIDTPIHFTITADAPMSAFWVPTLGSQIYAMNGMSSQLNLMANSTGEFPGYTTNINGPGYAEMKFMVHSRSQDDFMKWVKSTKSSPRTMDSAEYVRLSQPSTIKDERSYKLVDTHLYDTVIMKYMQGMDAPASEDATGLETVKAAGGE